jgi:superfamily II DNA or RNA helicase
MLYNHQKTLLDKNPDKHLLAWECGTGKTLASLKIAEKNQTSLLVITPKLLKENWQRALIDYPFEYKLLTKEEFKKEAPTLEKYEAVIIDEAHHFAGIKSKLSKNMAKYLKIHNIKYRWLLTATPFLSTPWNIYTLANLLGCNINYYSFKNKFFNDVRMGNRLVPVVKKGSDEILKRMILEIGSTIKLDACADIPPQTYETEFFDTTPAQVKAIKNLKEPIHITKWTKTHQIMGGTLKGDGYTEDLIIGSPKLDRLKELIIENPKSIVVCRYKNEIEYLKKELSSITDVEIMTGDTTNRDEIIQSLKNKDNYCFIVVAQCSEGWEIPECPTMIFYSYDFSLKNKVQMEGRIHRINNLKKNLYISLVIKDSIDEDVYECIQNKMDFQIALYEI